MYGFAKVSILAIALSILVPYFAERRVSLQLFYTNRPSKLPEFSAYANHAIKFENEVRNCEDIILSESTGTAYLSCDPGRDHWNTVMGIFANPDHQAGKIYYHQYGQSSDAPIQELPIENWSSNPRHKSTFHPLGIALDSKLGLLYVVSHAAIGPAIEVLQLSDSGTSARWIRTLTHPSINTPNSILPLSDHEILFSNDHAIRAEDNNLIATLETYLAYPGGSVVYFNTLTNEAMTLTNVPFPNGLARLNDTHIAVSSTSLPAVLIFEISPDFKTLTLHQKLRPWFLADNLRVDSNGKLLVAGHAYAPALTTVAKTNMLYDIDGTGAAGLLPGSQRGRAPSWVVEWDGNAEGTLRNLYIGHEFGTATTAVRDVGRKIGFIGGLFEKGIYVWRE